MEHPLLQALRPVADAIGAQVVAVSEIAEGDIPLNFEGQLVGGFRMPGLHGVLARLLSRIEHERGIPLRELSREDKQAVVRELNQLGAFTLRKAVEEVADAMGVSRFTIYNYLNSTNDTRTGSRENKESPRDDTTS